MRLLTDANRMSQKFVVVVICLNLAISALGATLANSGYPMLGANAHRNYKINRPVLCPAVSNGKSTVLNTVWTWPPADFGFWSFQNRHLTMDENGYIYVQGQASTNTVVKVHRSGNFSTASSQQYFPTPSVEPVLTHVQGNEFYMATPSTTYRFNALNMSDFVSAENLVPSFSPSSCVPYNNDYMLRSNIALNTNDDNSLTYYRISDDSIDETGLNYSPGSPGHVMVFKDELETFPVVVLANTLNNEPTVAHMKMISVVIFKDHARSFIDNNELMIITSPEYSLVRINPKTGAIVSNVNITSWQGSTAFTWDRAAWSMHHEGKLFGVLSYQSKYHFVDFLNSQMIFEDIPELTAQPLFSLDDNVVIAAVSPSYDEPVEIWGFDWNAWGVALKGILPQGVFFGDGNVGTPIISEDCNVHIVVDHTLYTLAPLPIQNVVPILECIDQATNLAYLSYNNLGSTEFAIPQLVDRNNIAPLNEAVVKYFSVGRGPRFPLAEKFDIGAGGVYTWQLEDYQLTFNASNPQFYCPTSVRIFITLRASEAFPSGFNQIVRDTFVNVTGVRDNRVTLVAKKRSVTQTSTLETELEISPGPNSDPTAAEIVQDFNANQRNQFTEQISSDPNAPANITISVDGKNLPNSIEGQIGIPPPVAQPQSENNPPVSTPVTSSASRVHFTLQMLFFFVLTVAVKY